jgi:uncharacterized membrane protein
MTQESERKGGLAGAAAGLGVTLGAVALGALMSKRSSRSGHATGNRDDAPGYTARGSSFGKYDVVGRTVTVRKPKSELFAFWRDFSNLPQVMENVDSIRTKDGTTGRAVWTIKAPVGRTVEVETEIVEEADTLIAWRSVEGSDIDTEGRVSFEDAPGDRGTRVTLIISYKPPGGEIGRTIAKAFLREPAVQARHDLKRFKMLMETGEIATSARRRDQTRAAKQEDHS